jgi:hypothetical protein
LQLEHSLIILSQTIMSRYVSHSAVSSWNLPSEIKYTVQDCPYYELNGDYVEYMGSSSYIHVNGCYYINYVNNSWGIGDGKRIRHACAYQSNSVASGPAESGWQCLHPNALDDPHQSGWMIPADRMRVIKYVPPAPKPKRSLKTKKSWLAVRLLNAGFAPELAADIEQKLVRNEGFALESDFAATPPQDFTAAYLTSIGVTAKGAQMRLISIHAEISAQYGTVSAAGAGAGAGATDVAAAPFPTAIAPVDAGTGTGAPCRPEVEVIGDIRSAPLRAVKVEDEKLRQDSSNALDPVYVPNSV